MIRTLRALLKHSAVTLLVLLAGASSLELTAATTTLYPTDDSFLDEILPNNNYGANGWVVARRAGTGFKEDIVVKFDLSSIPSGASISSATLYLYYSHNNDGDPQGRSLPAHEITGTWSEGTVTWNNQPGHDPATAASSTVPSAPPAWMTWDLTSSVQGMVDGTVTNYGWLIEDPTGGGAFVQIYFHSKENATNSPYLVVEYGAAEPEWEGPTEISQGSDGWIYPQTAVQEDYVHVVWRDDAASLLKYRRSTDRGSTWDPIKTLYMGVVHTPRVAVAGSYVHVVFRASSNTITYIRSSDYGANFGSAFALTTGTDDGYECDVAAAGSYVYVTWIKQDPNYDVLLKRSTDNGANWSAAINITGDGGTIEEEGPRVAASGNYAYVTWYYDDAGDVATRCLFRRSTDNGANWLSQMQLWQEAFGAFAMLSISAVGPNVIVDRDANEGTIPQGPAQRVSTNWGSSFASEEYLGRGNDRGPEVSASSYYSANGANVYIRGDTLFVATGLICCEEAIGILSGSSPRADIGASSSGDMHVVCNSLATTNRIYYYRHLTPGACDTATITPFADAYVNDAYPTSNYGSSTSLYVGDQNGNEPPQVCRTYMKFDLSSIPSTADIVCAKVYAKSANTGGSGLEVEAHYQRNDAWTEGGLTWNGQPAFDAGATDSRWARHVWNCWVVTGDVQNALDGDGTYGVVLMGENEPDAYKWIGCSSREDATAQYRPYLEVCYQAQDTCDCTPGDADGNGILNISDGVYLIAFIFAPPSPPPTPYATCSGDANCDCIVNVSDVVYLIAFIFGGGPAPCSCQEWLAACGPPLY